MTNFYQSIISSLPKHLQQFAVSQNYEKYSPQDHSVWRYIMRKNLDFLSKHAHPAYLNGLEKTGITVEKIPDIDEMNSNLEKIGWRAIIVDGFIPPAAFMEFQALKILVISAEMRTFGHLMYTPAPDIVHEAAGHAPIIADNEYAEYLQRFGEYGSKAMSSKEDYDIYEAIRYLSIIKEYPNATNEEISKAEKELEIKIAANTNPSESTKLSRLHWWTVEYGLYGTPENFSIYGAGLLSSVGESQHCLNPKVKKIPLTVECVNQNYDITKMQPQLFVNRDWQHLKDVLNEYSKTMSFNVGGLDSLKLALESENIATYVYSSGLQVSGKITNIQTNNGEISYIQTTGSSALSIENQELGGHGISYHRDGFGSPVGKLKNQSKGLEDFSDSELENLNIKEGQICPLEFATGIKISGKVKSITYKNGKIILISFTECTVYNHKNEILFQPAWGVYDMAVGDKIISVFTGTADKCKFSIFPKKSENTAIPVEHTKDQQELFKIYKQINNLRDSQLYNYEDLTTLYSQINNKFAEDWLVKLELLELAKSSEVNNGLIDKLINELQSLKNHSEEYNNLITSGLDLLGKQKKV
ncbi:MAG: aromatic amino acid hydroxylase [Calditrichia bacterium]|nr:aromatic amino acid hydroxylase [Calditrichia bacterium]